METIENAQEKKVQIKSNIIAYLKQTAKHLFITDNNYFQKVFTYNVNGEDYFISIVSNGKDTTVFSGNINHYVEHHGNNAKKVLSDKLFSSEVKTTSIPNFKEMRIRMDKVYKDLNDGKTIGEIVIHLLGLEPKK